MKFQEVILRAMSGEINWIQAAHILGISDRHMRRLKKQYEEEGYDGLLDRRRQVPSPKRAPFDEVQRILRLYKEQYFDYNVLHFHETIQREHGVTLSYSFVKKALQEAGLVKKRKPRGKHRKRREPRACFGELVHIDGSFHPWLTLVPDEKQTLIALEDDATNHLYYAQLWPEETTEAALSALWDVVEQYGLFMALYSDRAGWAFHTPSAGGKVDRKKLTQVGKALEKAGIEHIPSYSPEARGRVERLNRTLQDRLISELRFHGITEMEAANRYLREVFIPRYNERFTHPPRDQASAFVGYGNADLNQIFCFEEERTVAKDNTVRFENVILQIDKQPGVPSCAGWHVVVRRHLDGRFSIWKGPRLLGRFEQDGTAAAQKAVA
ncbi:MAG: ISNCY family transposase [Deltaproteobacteria bacterium]|nr:ISNCY family transposase [Deltaproteobacteria bacterium]